MRSERRSGFTSRALKRTSGRFLLLPAMRTAWKLPPDTALQSRCSRMLDGLVVTVELRRVLTRSGL